MSTQFSTGPTRQIQPGDTPDLNDGLLSREAAVDNIARGEACFVIGGLVTVATQSLDDAGHSPFVPVESVDNSGNANLPISGVSNPQRVAMRVEASSAAIDPGEYVKISATDGQVEKWDITTDAGELKYAKYLGKEATLLNRAAASPFGETLTAGIVPDQTLTPSAGTTDDNNVGWFQLEEGLGGQ
jgi:hypothetical protein